MKQGDVVDLQVYPHPLTVAQRATLVEAKRALGVDVMVRTVPAVPGGGGVVLAFGVVPPFACSYAPVSSGSADGLRDALSACLGFTEDSRVVSMAGWLSHTMGARVVEVAS